MALWHDPLDELIEELEGAIPVKSAHDIDDMPSVAEFQFYMHAKLRGSDAERRGADTDPRFARMRAHLARMAAWQKTRSSGG